MPRALLPRPFPMAPLLAAIDHPIAREAARTLGIQTRQLHRLTATGLTIDQADDLACNAGLHPLNVWPDIWAAETDAEWIVEHLLACERARTIRWVRTWIRRHCPRNAAA